MEKTDEKSCIFCGAKMVWAGNGQCCEHGDYDDSDDAVINYYQCPKCGRNYEIWDPPQEKREEEYKEYWEGNGTI
jgi:hypothetical protein